MTVRRAAAAALFLFIVYGSIEWRLFGRVFDPQLDRTLAYNVGAVPPGYQEFLDGVVSRTRRGDTIALLAPARAFHEYPFQRTVYGLPGRVLLPVISPKNERLPENVDRAAYVIAWNEPSLPPGWRVLWRHEKGVLLGR